jgi:hypothetical protein
VGLKCHGSTWILYLSEYAFTESFESAKALPFLKFCIASPDRLPTVESFRQLAGNFEFWRYLHASLPVGPFPSIYFALGFDTVHDGKGTGVT